VNRPYLSPMIANEIPLFHLPGMEDELSDLIAAVRP